MTANRDVQDHATEFMNDAEAMAIEDTIWWAVGRRSIVRNFMNRATKEKIEKILEIGCGSGGDLPLLSRYGQVWGLERSAVLAKRARQRGVAVNVYESDFFEQEIDRAINLFCLFDVLEHIENDEKFVRQLVEKANRNHLLLISVPACQFLFGPHDVMLHHYRRYSRRGLEKLLKKYGYEIVHSSYFMFFLFPLAVFSRFLEGVRHRLGFDKKKVNIGRVPTPINWLFTKTLQFEAYLNAFLLFPIGLWVVLLARRTGNADSALQPPGAENGPCANSRKAGL